VADPERRSAPAALDAWVLATGPEAVAYATSLLRDRAAAEDIVQDCYCRLLARADIYDLPHDGRKLLFKAITNACINARTRVRLMFRLDGDDETGEGLGSRIADRTAVLPEVAVMQKELELLVAEALRQLPDQQRAALELRSLGHSQQDVADALDISASNAGVLIHRARQALSRILTPYLEERPR
jgi:RNA polymerase sigma factor (sigma-70 family)